MDEQTSVNVVAETIIEQNSPRKRSRISPLFVIIVLFIIVWILVRPGVFTIQPIGALPDGITFIFHSRGSEMPFFSSPDGLCLETQGSFSLFCRAGAISAASELADRIIIRLPYSHWAYLRSTGGYEFDQ